MVKIVKALEDSHIFMKGSAETLKNDVKKGGALPILPMLLGALGVSLFSGRRIYRAGSGGNKYNCGKDLYRAGEGLFRAGPRIKKKALMPPHRLTNFEIISYFNHEPRFNGVYSRNNLPKTKKMGHM